MKTITLRFLTLLALGGSPLSCGAGIPVQITIDHFTVDVNIEDWVGVAEKSLQSTGFLGESVGIPEKWPDSLPHIHYDLEVVSPPIPLDLTPDAEGEDDPNKAQYEQIDAAQKAIKRVQIDDLILRVERSNLSIDLPSLELQVADDPNEHPNNRRAWITIGILDGPKANEVGDIPFRFSKGGETYLNTQLAEEAREFALRIKGKMSLNTALNPDRPRGQATFRIITRTTFYLLPEKALEGQDIPGL
jgi:hypothetical protein